MFTDHPCAEASGLETQLVLEAEGPVGRAMVRMAIDSHLPVVAVSLDPGALRLLKLENPEADLDVVIGSVVDVRSTVWLADDVRKLHRKISGVIAPIETPEPGVDTRRSRSDALDLLRSQIRFSSKSLAR